MEGGGRGRGAPIARGAMGAGACLPPVDPPRSARGTVTPIASVALAVERARPALDEIAMLAAERPVAVFAHGGIGRVLRGLFLRVPDSEILTMDQPQDAFYRLHGGAAARIGTQAEQQGRASEPARPFHTGAGSQDRR